MKTFTVAFISGREHKQFDWFAESFYREIDRYGLVQAPNLIVIGAAYNKQKIERHGFCEGTLKRSFPKPNIWQGQYRVTKEDWWAVSASRNTAICLCETDWICFFDDRCVLMPGYLDALEDAMIGNYIMAGAYEKRHNMTVENGVIRHGGIVTAEDCRERYGLDIKAPIPFDCGGEWLFGANWACPLEWLLECNGVPEIADGQGFEDVLTGLLLANNGHPIKYDLRAKVVQDRTPEFSGPVYRKEDKGRGGPVKDEKGHKLLAMFNKPEAKQAIHTPGFDFDIRKVRADILAGQAWPVPGLKSYKDWYDGQDISTFK